MTAKWVDNNTLRRLFSSKIHLLFRKSWNLVCLWQKQNVHEIVGVPEKALGEISSRACVDLFPFIHKSCTNPLEALEKPVHLLQARKRMLDAQRCPTQALNGVTIRGNIQKSRSNATSKRTCRVRITFTQCADGMMIMRWSNQLGKLLAGPAYKWRASLRVSNYQTIWIKQVQKNKNSLHNAGVRFKGFTWSSEADMIQGYSLWNCTVRM